MTVSELIDVLGAYEGDLEVMLGSNAVPIMLVDHRGIELFGSMSKKVVVILGIDDGGEEE